MKNIFQAGQRDFPYGAPFFENKDHRIQMRFNQEHVKTPGYFWRIIVDGVEFKAKSIVFKAAMRTEEFTTPSGEVKGNAICVGRPVFYENGTVEVIPVTSQAFHILSLQRTASKSLVSALDKLVSRSVDPLKIDGQPLAELLHDWGNYRYTFAPHLKRPFGHEDDVVYYHTHPNYNHRDNICFDQLYSRHTRQFGWVPHVNNRTKHSALEHAMRVLSRLAGPAQGRSFVLKTQLADIISDHRANSHSRNVFLGYLRKFHEDNNVLTIKLTRSDKLAWLCSMILTEASGVFIASKAQRDAIEHFRRSPLLVSKDTVDRFLRLWDYHAQCIDADISLTTDDFADGDLNLISSDGALVPITVPNEREFSTTPSSELIANLDQIQEWLETKR